MRKMCREGNILFTLRQIFCKKGIHPLQLPSQQSRSLKAQVAAAAAAAHSQNIMAEMGGGKTK